MRPCHRGHGGGEKKADGTGGQAAEALGRSRGGFGSKLDLVTDGRDTPLAVKVTGGQVYKATQAESVMEQVAVPRPLGRLWRLTGDKAYRARRIRRWLWEHGAKPVIPRKVNE